MSFQACCSFSEHRLRYFWWNLRDTTTFKAQKGRKEIVKIVHVTSVHASWFVKLASKTDTEEKKSLNKVIIFIFFAHKKYSCSFIKLRSNHWCHLDFFKDVLTTFLGLEFVSCVDVYARSESSRISSKIYSFVLQSWTKEWHVGE